MRINHPKFRRLSTEGELLVVTLKIVYSVHAFFVKHNQTFVGGPAELDDLALIPLFPFNNSVSVVCGPVSGTNRKDQETLSRRGIQLYLRP